MWTLRRLAPPSPSTSEKQASIPMFVSMRCRQPASQPYGRNRSRIGAYYTSMLAGPRSNRSGIISPDYSAINERPGQVVTTCNCSPVDREKANQWRARTAALRKASAQRLVGRAPPKSSRKAGSLNCGPYLYRPLEAQIAANPLAVYRDIRNAKSCKPGAEVSATSQEIGDL
jgi:hypothetical protein